MCHRSFVRIITRKRGLCDHGHERLRGGGAKAKDKGILRDIDELTVSVSGEARECESRIQGESVASVVERVWSA